MIVVEELKLNKFRQVSVPSNKDLFERIGSRNVPVSDGQVANFHATALMPNDMLEDYIQEGKMPLDTSL